VVWWPCFDRQDIMYTFWDDKRTMEMVTFCLWKNRPAQILLPVRNNCSLYVSQHVWLLMFSVAACPLCMLLYSVGRQLYCRSLPQLGQLFSHFNCCSCCDLLDFATAALTSYVKLKSIVTAGTSFLNLFSSIVKAWTNSTYVLSMNFCMYNTYVLYICTIYTVQYV
jgi:hypothetical protein